MTERTERTWRRLTSERAVGYFVAGFLVLQAAGIAGIVYAIRSGGETAGRVEVLERDPTPEEVRRRVRAAIGSLTEREARELLDVLLSRASPAQRRELARAIRAYERDRARERRRQRAEPPPHGGSRPPPTGDNGPGARRPRPRPPGPGARAPAPPTTTPPAGSSSGSPPSSPPPEPEDRRPTVTAELPDPLPDVTVTVPVPVPELELP